MARRWRVLGVGAAVTLSLAVLGAVTWEMVEQDRQVLLEDFAQEKIDQLDEVVGQVQEDLEEVTHDLVFVANLVAAETGEGETRDSIREHRYTLHALLNTINAYQAIALLAPDGTPLTTVTVPDRTPEITPQMRQVAAAATAAPEPTVAASDPVVDHGRWMRAFARRSGLPANSPVVVVLVDMGPILGKLRVLATDRNTRILILGPQGIPVAFSDPGLVEALKVAGGASSPIERLLRTDRPRDRILGADEAPLYGLAHAVHVVAHSLIHMEGARWSVVTITSLAPLELHEERIIWRISAGAGAMAALLLLFGVYFFWGDKQRAVLTERLRRSIEVARINEKANKILERIPTGVIELVDEDTVASINSALATRLPNPSVGRSLRSTLSGANGATVERLHELVRATRQSGRIRSLVAEHLVLFGTEGQFSVHAIPLVAGEGERVLLVIDDLTELRALESHLLRAEKLSTVGILAAGIAHEVGTPLGVIRGRAEYILGKIGEASPHAAGLRVIIEQIDRIARTIRSLLDFSRVHPVAPSSVPLAPVLRAVKELLRFEADRRHITLDVHIDETLPPLAADGDQVQQVLVNLIMNACDACSQGDRVQVRARVAQISTDTLGEHLLIDVKDSGAGIAPDSIHRIFDPFFTTKKRGAGTGLGLTIVQQIVRNHGGRIEISSEPGTGTLVTLAWPVAREHAAAGANGANH